MSYFGSQFKASAERLLTSYDFLDIAKGYALQKFYGGRTSDGTTPTTMDILQDAAFFSDTKEQTYGTGGTAFGDTSLGQLNFSVIFNTPRIIQGIGLVNISYGFTGATLYGTVHLYTTCSLKKTSGSTTTLYSSKTLEVAGVTDANKIGAAYLNIPKTNFKIGDTMTLNIDVRASITGGNQPGGITYHVGIDPKNRAVTGLDTASSMIELYIPIKIET